MGAVAQDEARAQRQGVDERFAELGFDEDVKSDAKDSDWALGEASDADRVTCGAVCSWVERRSTSGTPSGYTAQPRCGIGFYILLLWLKAAGDH